MKKNKLHNILPLILSLVGTAIGVAINFLLARLLGSSTYGDLQYLNSLAATFSSFLLVGLNWFVVKNVRNERLNKTLMNKMFSIYLISTSFYIPIFFYVAHNNSELLTNNPIGIALVIILAIEMGVSTLGGSYFQGNDQYSVSVLLTNFIPHLIILIVSGVFYFTGLINYLDDYYILIYAIIYAFITIFILLKTFRKFDTKIEAKDLSSIFYFFGVTITYSLTTEITKILQNDLYGNSKILGIISVIMSLLSMSSLVTGIFLNLTKPYFSKCQREGDTKALFDMFRLNSRMSCYICIPFYIVIGCCCDNFLGLLFGESYVGFPLIGVILAIKCLVSDTTGPTGTMLSMTGHEKIELINGFINIGVYALFAFIFSFNQVYGLCLALMASTIVVNMIKFIEVWYIYKIAPFDRRTLLGIILIYIVDFVLLFGLRFLGTNWMWFGITFAAGCITIVINCFLGLHPKDVKKFVEMRL